MGNLTTIALLSGGLDSATAAALAKEAGHKVIGLSFNYGQRHRRELIAATNIAKHLELIEHQIINVNLAAWGGSSLTDMTQSLPEEQKTALLSQIPLKRLGKPEDIAEVVGFLVSDKGGYVTGETIHVNGGMYMG